MEGTQNNSHIFCVISSKIIKTICKIYILLCKNANINCVSCNQGMARP
jgi:hypothetical protein